jgi:hypothetical protein
MISKYLTAINTIVPACHSLPTTPLPQHAQPSPQAVGTASALATFSNVGVSSLFVALGLHTVPIVCLVVIQTAVLVVGVAVSLILPAGLTPTVTSAFPVPCCPSTTTKVFCRSPNGKPAAAQAR